MSTNRINFLHKKNHLITYYWDLAINKLIECQNPSRLIEKNIIEDFKNGILYSRNIILTKSKLDSRYILPELRVDKNVLFKKNNSIFIKPSPYINLKIAEETKFTLPRSGKYFIEILKDLNFSQKNVLDIGTGYFGFLARHAKQFGAKKVIATDINTEAIEYTSSIQENGIEYRISDVYSSIKNDEKFDIIISNPPQLPQCSGGKVHDVAGEDGLLVINKIIQGFKEHTNENSRLYLLIFDFLFESVLRTCQKNKLDTNVMAYYNKHLRKGGETEKRKKYIEKIFPGFKFKKDNNGFYHRTYILEIQSYEHNT